MFVCVCVCACACVCACVCVFVMFYVIAYLQSQQDVYTDGAQMSSTEHFATILVFFVCFGVSIALILLGGWHVYLISTGITSIEFYSNRSEMSAMKKEGKVTMP